MEGKFLIWSLITHVGFKIAPGAKKIFRCQFKTWCYLGAPQKIAEATACNNVSASGHFKITKYVNNNFLDNIL